MVELDAVTDAVLVASRVLVAVAARSLAEVTEEVTLPQYRALVILATRGPQSVGALAKNLDVLPSTATRLCDRLVRKRLVTRRRSASSRREVEVALTAAGGQLVESVLTRRRSAIAEIVTQVAPDHRETLVRALKEFADAAGEAPEQVWSLGWTH